MQSVFDQGAPAPCPDPFNLAAHVLAGGIGRGTRPALQVIGPTPESWSFQRLTDAVLGCAGGLLRLGLVPGDRVLLRLGNCADFPVVFLACIAVGLVPVPTSAQWTVPEVSRACRDLQPALIVASAGIARPALPGCPTIEGAALAALMRGPPADFAMGDPDRLAYIIYTSGTSGQPRAVLHAHRAIWARRMMIAGWTGLNGDDRILHAGAFNWTYTLGTGLLDPWSIGATALIPADGTPVARLPQLIGEGAATIFAAVPGVYRQILQPGMNLAAPSLRHGLSAGEKLPDAVQKAWAAATGTLIHEAIGLSECSTFVSGAPDKAALPGTLGWPQPGRKVAVVDQTGQPVPLQTPGILAVHRSDPGLFLGYLDAPADTAERFAGAWFLTGDLVCMDATGAITLLGRTDDMMNAGGFRVSPLEVEDALARHPQVQEVAVTEVRVKADTTVIAAFYVADTDIPDLAAFASQHLARYKQPRILVRRDSLPKNANGKVQRRILRQDHEANHDKT